MDERGGRNDKSRGGRSGGRGPGAGPPKRDGAGPGGGDRRGGPRREGGGPYRGRGGPGSTGRDGSRGGRGRDSGRRSEQESTARTEAARMLVRIEQDDAYVGLLRRGSDRRHDEATDRQITEYVAGVTRWRRWLDHAITRAYRGDFAEMEPLLRQVLRIGAYDLLIGKAPDHAAINEAVNAAHLAVRQSATGVTNAVLRRVAGDRDAAGEETDDGLGDDEAERLAVRWSHPTWLVRRWLERYGKDATMRLLEHNNRAPIHGLRVVGPAAARASFSDMLVEARIDTEPSPYLNDFVRVIRLQPVIRAKWIDRGYCFVQDESTGLVVRLLDPQPGNHVIDACAAPGGKSLYAASRMGGKGRITAVDVSAARLGLLEEAAVRAKTPIETVAADFAEWAESAEVEPADRVLLDAPCSGLGVLARRADLRWRRSEEGLAELTALQDRLLDAAARVVRPGGVLVYATCTIEPEENAERVKAFLERHPEFEVESASRWVPAQMVDENGFFASLPHRDDIDGAFGARMRRRVV